MSEVCFCLYFRECKPVYNEECSTTNEYSCQDVQECQTEYETVCDDGNTGYQEPAPVYDSNFNVSLIIQKCTP